MAACSTVDRAVAQQPQPIPIATLNRTAPVKFEKDILPLLRKSCLACHSATEAQGGLVLETPRTILKGGDRGP
ncbi:MAG: hypothetical protein IID45_08230, partial [Planctomycetes bacterium]|nr:hypothetical protein [Planctomycetota bacterium]